MGGLTAAGDEHAYLTVAQFQFGSNEEWQYMQFGVESQTILGVNFQKKPILKILSSTKARTIKDEIPPIVLARLVVDVS